MSIGSPVSGDVAVVGGAGTAGDGPAADPKPGGSASRVDGVAACGFGRVVAVVDVAPRVVVVVGFGLGRVVVVVDVDVVVVGGGWTVSTRTKSVPQAVPATTRRTGSTVRSGRRCRWGLCPNMGTGDGTGPACPTGGPRARGRGTDRGKSREPSAGALSPGGKRPKHRRMATRPLDDIAAPAAHHDQPAAAEIIRTDGLTKTFPGRGGGPEVAAVDHLALSVRAGEIFGLLGPNGAGKTTTVGMLTTRVVPTSGRAVVGGVDIVADPARAKQVIGVVPQSNTLDRELTVWQNLYFHGRYFGMPAEEARSEADRLLTQFRLADRGRANVATLSGGMAQRLMVARAILHRPRILFLDEPTAGLDPQSRLALWEILADLHAAGQTILLTTHYMEEADQLCDRVAIMDHGRILALDTPAGLKRSLGADTIVRVGSDGDLRRLTAVLAAMEGARSAHVTDGGVLLYLSGPVARILPRIFSVAEANGFPVTDLTVTEPTLEAVFITLTGKDLRD
jgi:ABC-2 type transport system ATP-binding protein